MDLLIVPELFLAAAVMLAVRFILNFRIVRYTASSEQRHAERIRVLTLIELSGYHGLNEAQLLFLLGVAGKATRQQRHFEAVLVGLQEDKLIYGNVRPPPHPDGLPDSEQYFYRVIPEGWTVLKSPSATELSKGLTTRIVPFSTP